MSSKQLIHKSLEADNYCRTYIGDKDKTKPHKTGEICIMYEIAGGIIREDESFGRIFKESHGTLGFDNNITGYGIIEFPKEVFNKINFMEVSNTALTEEEDALVRVLICNIENAVGIIRLEDNEYIILESRETLTYRVLKNDGTVEYKDLDSIIYDVEYDDSNNMDIVNNTVELTALGY